MPCCKPVHFKQTRKYVALPKNHWLSSKIVNSTFPSISDKTSFPMKSLSGKQSQILFIALWMRNFGPASLYCVLAHVFEQIYLILQLLLLSPIWVIGIRWCELGVPSCWGISGTSESSQTKENKIWENTS